MPQNPADLYASPIARISLPLRIAVVLLLALYLLDTLWFAIRRTYPATGQASGTIHRRRILAISDKGNKTEYTTDALLPEEDIPCVHSLFPHAAQKPCWYVARHAKDPIPM